MIYLDNAATTQIDDNVVDAMIPYLKNMYGNPGSIYELGLISKYAIEDARIKVAKMINANPDQIVFTSGGSESNNMVMKFAKIKSGKKIACTSVEHDSILNYVYNNDNGVVMDVDEDCTISIETVEKAILNGAGLISVMYVNNETGAVNNIKEISKLCNKHRVLLHTDCVQAISCKKIDVKDLNVDFLSLSSHKIHGCKGVGCLYIKDKSSIESMITGGRFQEFGLRGGTENVHGIVGFGQAASNLINDCNIDYMIMKDYLHKSLTKSLPTHSFRINCESSNDHGKIVSITFFGIDAQTLVMMLNSKDIYISAGSACNSNESSPSHVLKSIGFTDDDAYSTIRISFSKYNIINDVDILVKYISECISVLSNVK